MRAVRADSIQGEAPFLPTDLHDLVVLRRRIIEELGEPVNVANGIVGWLTSKAAGERDLTSAPTKSRYRKVLARLDPPRIHVRVPAHVLSSSALVAA